MKVTLQSQITLGNKPYQKGTQEIPDHLYGNQAFKKHVKQGTIFVHPRDAASVKAQASKDARAMQKAIGAKKSAAAAIAARAQVVPAKSMRDGTPMSQADREAQKAPIPAQAQPEASSSTVAQASPAPSKAAVSAAPEKNS